MTPERAQKLLIAQLMATRDQFAASIGQIDTTLLALGVDVDRLGEPAADCEHPADQIVNHHTTLDDSPDDFECMACRARQSEPFHPEE